MLGMIHQVTGTILATEPNYTVVDIHGLALRVHTPPLTLPIGDIHTLYTHLIVRENALDLYGFATEEGRWLFEQLLTVPKVGPKTALQLIAKSDVSHCITAIANGEVSEFKRVTGTGGKTAENVITTLKSIMEPLAQSISSANQSPTPNTIQRDAIAALVSLGFSEREATDRVSLLTELERIEDIITEALRQ
jgi:Holliday junction DNA helicase RuvA